MKENIIFEEAPKNTRIDRDDELVKMVTAEPTPEEKRAFLNMMSAYCAGLVVIAVLGTYAEFCKSHQKDKPKEPSEKIIQMVSDIEKTSAALTNAREDKSIFTAQRLEIRQQEQVKALEVEAITEGISPEEIMPKTPLPATKKLPIQKRIDDGVPVPSDNPINPAMPKTIQKDGTRPNVVFARMRSGVVIRYNGN